VQVISQYRNVFEMHTLLLSLLLYYLANNHDVMLL